jgi:hypothetical protein
MSLHERGDVPLTGDISNAETPGPFPGKPEGMLEMPLGAKHGHDIIVIAKLQGIPLFI